MLHCFPHLLGIFAMNRREERKKNRLNCSELKIAWAAPFVEGCRASSKAHSTERERENGRMGENRDQKQNKQKTNKEEEEEERERGGGEG